MNQITSLRTGSVVNRFSGRETKEGLLLPVSGIVDEDAFVSVNGVPAEVTGNTFTAEIPVTELFTDVVMTAENNCGRPSASCVCACSVVSDSL